MARPSKFSEEFKQDFVRRYESSGQTVKAFTVNGPINYKTAIEWIKRYGNLKRHKHGPYTPEQRKQAVAAYFKSGMTQEIFAATWGISPSTLCGWLQKYDEKGAKGLETYAPAKENDKRKGRKISQAVIEEIIRIKQADPKSGLKYIKQVMSRFKGLSVSTGSIKKTLNEAEIPLVQKEKKRRRSADKVRTFERALPMQLWQSDITSYLLTRHSQRVYLTVFMDDYSRYIVAWNLASRQTTEFVSETLLEGTSKFGKPEEVLTDQGRQYFAWRGKSDFQRILDREGIKHVVSRSHHPQTLGKCERFWETVGQEFWERLKPQDLNDAKRRFAHFINHYNHFRPHQGIDGLTPADRFFGLENEVRSVIEQTMTENQLRLAIGEEPRTPVFLVGQIGDQPISLHGEGGKLVLRTEDGSTKELSYGEFGHFKKGEDNGRARADETYSHEKRSQERDCDSTEDSNSCERDLELGFAGGEADCPQNSCDDSSVLDGPYDEEASCGIVIDTSTKDMATLGASSCGNGSGTFEATSNEKGYEGDYEQGRRSEVFEKENSRTREDSTLSEISDRCAQGNAWSDGCEHSNRRSGTSGDGEDAD